MNTIPSDTPPTKAVLRVRLKERVKGMGREEREFFAQALCQLVQQFPGWIAAQRVLLFAPLPDEPDIWPLVRAALDAGKRVAFPSFDPVRQRYGAREVRDTRQDMVAGEFGVREPRGDCPEIALTTLDLVLVPGLGFSAEGGRLGRGGGFYDRLLAATDAVRMGVGFDDQIVPWLPLEPHDVQLHFIATPSAIHAASGACN